FAGARSYFRAHEFGNTTLADLLEELSSASGRDLESWAQEWLQTTGVATVTVEPAEGAVGIERDDRRPHRFGLGRYEIDGSGGLVCAQRYDVELREGTESV